MELVHHRVNTLDALRAVPEGRGAELDVRSRGGRLVVHHDPHHDGPELARWLDAWAAAPRGTLVVNPKEDGLEDEILGLLGERGITRFFLLDLTLPTTVRLAVRGGVRAVAVRASEYEPVALADRFAGLVDWVWLDCFAGEPPDEATVRHLAARFRVCLVSPELQGHPAARIARFLHLRPLVAAACTKHPDAWAA